MHVQTGCSGNDSDTVIPSLPCCDSQPADSPRFLMDGLGTKHRVLGTKHRVWFQQFGTMHAKRRKVHADDNEADVSLTNCTIL